jgi:hypothetical protein
VMRVWHGSAIKSHWQKSFLFLHSKHNPLSSKEK